MSIEHVSIGRAVARGLVVALAATLLPVSSAYAQYGLDVRVETEDARVTTSRRANGRLVTTVASGDVLEVLHTSGDPYHDLDSNWYLVLLPADDLGWPHMGWMSGADVTEVPLTAPRRPNMDPRGMSLGAPSVTSARPTSPSAPTPEPRLPAAMAMATAAPEPVEIPDVVLHFEFDKANLSAEATSMLDCTMEMVVSGGQDVSFSLEGHTDASGPESYNEALGLRRAEAVRNYLIEQHQVPAGEISIVSLGENQPAVSNDTRDGRAQNRRVVVRVGG